MQELSDKGGWIGVHGVPHASRVVGRGLRGLARRGGNAAGVVALGDALHTRREADDRFLTDEPALDTLDGDVALGQRHRGEGSTSAQMGLADPLRLPRAARLADGHVAVALHGGMVDQDAVRRELLHEGAAMTSASVDEILLHLVARSRQRTMVNRFVDALWKVRGGFAAVLAAPGLLVGVRDPYGLRPLWMGRVDGGTVLCTDPVGIVVAGGEVGREVGPGEMVIIDPQGIVTVRPFPKREAQPCIQEGLMLAAADTPAGRDTTWALRRALGAAAATLEAPAEVVLPAHPDAAPSALGFAEARGVPLHHLLDTGSEAQPWVSPDMVRGKQIVLVSMAWSERVRPLVRALHTAGAVDVRLVVIPPRRVRACPYGVHGDTDMVGEVTERFAVRLGLTDAVGLDLARLRGVVSQQGLPGDQMCAACLGGPPPVAHESGEAGQLPLFEG